MIHWAEFYYEVGNSHRFQNLNFDLGWETSVPLFEFCDEVVAVTIPPFSLGYILLHHANYDWLHAGQFA